MARKFWKNIFLSIYRKLRFVETEIWDFSNGENKIIDPSLPDGNYRVGIGLYLVPADFCSNN